MTEISLCMIVKNEENNLPACLDGLDQLVSEIIIVDTGSTDRTKDIAGSYSTRPDFQSRPVVRLYETTWEDDFSKARNIALKHATKDWILILDADDRLDRNSFAAIKKIIKQKDVLACFLQIHSYIEKDKYMITRLVNLFRNREDIFYEGIVHNQVLGTINAVMKKEPGWKVEIIDDIIIRHYGYNKENVIKTGKLERSIRMIDKALSQDNLSLENQLYYRINKVSIYKQQKEYEKSKSSGEEILDTLRKENSSYLYRQPVNSLLYSVLSELYMENGNTTEAERVLREALLYFPDAPSFYYNLGFTLVKNKQFAEALPYFEKCVSFGKNDNYNKFIPFNLDILTYLSLYMAAACYLKLRDITKTYEYLEECLKINSGYEPAVRLRNILKK